MNPSWIDPRREGTSSLLACYDSLLQAVGVSVKVTAGSPVPTVPYNLLVTRQWLLLIPRSNEYFERISINALGFAEVLLVKDTAQLAILQKHGPMTALRRVGLPRKA
jgi:ATP adenylyltransferase